MKPGYGIRMRSFFNRGVKIFDKGAWNKTEICYFLWFHKLHLELPPEYQRAQIYLLNKDIPKHWNMGL